MKVTDFLQENLFVFSESRHISNYTNKLTEKKSHLNTNNDTRWLKLFMVIPLLLYSCFALDTVIDGRSIVLPYVAWAIGILEIFLRRSPVVTHGYT